MQTKAFQDGMKVTNITACDRLRDQLIVKFADGYTYAFTHEFLWGARIEHGQLLHVEIEK
jgi:hypothetical protein